MIPIFCDLIKFIGVYFLLKFISQSTKNPSRILLLVSRGIEEF